MMILVSRLNQYLATKLKLKSPVLTALAIVIGCLLMLIISTTLIHGMKHNQRNQLMINIDKIQKNLSSTQSNIRHIQDDLQIQDQTIHQLNNELQEHTMKLNQIIANKQPASAEEAVIQKLQDLIRELKKDQMLLTKDGLSHPITIEQLPFNIEAIEIWNQQLLIRLMNPKTQRTALLGEGDIQEGWKVVHINARDNQVELLNQQQHAVIVQLHHSQEPGESL